MSLLEQLARELQGTGGPQFKHTTPTGTPSTPYMYGPNGLWSVSGVERDVISTRVQPRGLAGALPARGTNVMNPLYPFLTGFTDPSETQPDGVCDDPPTAGQMKNVLQTAEFGRYSYMTRELDLTRLGQRINRGEFTDLTLINNDLLQRDGDNGIVVPGTVPGNAALANDVMQRFIEVGIKFQNKLSRQLYEGNPSNNTDGGGYKEFPGLDILIGTGKRDAITGQTAPAIDSLIMNYNYANINDLSGDADIVNVITYMLRSLKTTAERTGMGDVDWAVVMREGAFYEITKMWPCSYVTTGCQFRATDGTIHMNVSANDQIAMRDAMRQGRYLVVDGAQVRVIFDDAIPEETSGDTNRVNAGSFSSDIYIVPLSILNGTYATLFWEYFDFGGPYAMMDPNARGPLVENFFWSDGGRYVWHFKPPKNWCVQWVGLIQPRLILRTPHLAAKLQNVQYTSLLHTRDAYPDDPYFVNGGATSRDTAPSWYPSWTS